MSIPGFAAEASVYKTRGQYRASGLARDFRRHRHAQSSHRQRGTADRPLGRRRRLVALLERPRLLHLLQPLLVLVDVLRRRRHRAAVIAFKP